MDRKIVTLLKMIILSLGLIAVFSFIGKEEGKKVDDAGNTNYSFAMGTSVSVSIYDNEIDSGKVTCDINQEIKNLDEKYISWRNAGSELNQLNENYIPNQGYEISPELYVILKQSLALCIDSQGALDITIRPLATLWNIEGHSDGEFIPPNDDSVAEALQRVDYNKLNILSETYSNANNDLINEKYYVALSEADMIIDLGATGKGYALDRAKEILDDSQVKGALVTVGGSILVYGDKQSKEDWHIGVRNPLKAEDTNAMIGYLNFPAGTITCVSSSGGYEKYKTYQGVDYHHILDSKTGYPSDSGLLSVTVVCVNGLVSDGLSTACFVLGYEKSKSLLDKYNAEAVFMDIEGNIIVTDGLKNNWVEK